MLTLFSGLLALSAAHIAEARCIPSPPPNVRFPTLSGPCTLPQNQCNKPWPSPPDGWQYGTWHDAYTSQSNALSAFNFEIFYAPLLPTAPDTTAYSLVDLQSFNPPNSSELATIYSVDVPTPALGKEFYTYSIMIEGQTVELTPYEWLAWGYDTKGDGYIMLYDAPSTGAPGLPETAAIDVLSRAADGPTQETLEQLLCAIRGFGNANLTALADAVVKTPRNGLRMPGIVLCDAECQSNAALAAELK